jgi:23S rRNA (guanosine2251-2'-O)-methyltransferase
MKTTLIYGYHAVIGALEHQSENVLSLYCQDQKTGERLMNIEAKAKTADIPIQTMSGAKLDKLVQNDHHQGFAAKVRLAPPKEEKDLLAWLETTTRVPLLLILEGLEDPHNVGACLRSAEALGVDWVVMPRSRGVAFNPTISKVACGADQIISMVVVSNIVRFIEQIQKRGVWVIGTCGPSPDKQLSKLSQVDLKGPTALVMGAEGDGLRRLTLQVCDTLAYIPLAGSTESLNVSVATGICLYECIRQRC